MISIVISWYNRDEIKNSIASVLSVAKALGGEVIIVNFSGNGKKLTRLLGIHQQFIRIIQVNAKSFNKTWAQNIGASYAKEPVIFFCDCDIILHEKVIKKLHRYLLKNGEYFATLSNVKETEINSIKNNNFEYFGYELLVKLKNGREVRVVDNEENSKDGTRQAPGLLMVRKSHFEQINGYNGDLFGWGWEDQDIICRLTLGAGLKRHQFGSAMHISHGDSTRMQAYGIFENRWESRDKMFRNALYNYDHNKFQGTYIEDKSKFNSEELL